MLCSTGRILSWMPSWLRRRSLRELPREQYGHALVEAALIFPILLGLFLGVSEFSEALTVNRRLQGAAHTAADLVSRTPSVTVQELDGIKAMIDETMKPYSVTSLGVILTSIVADETNGTITTVAWSETRGAGVSPHAVGAAITIPAGLTLPNTSVIFVEVKYSFHSTLATMIVGSVPVQAEAYQRPRSTLQVLKN
jgi:Flp pilus assembly protein TadG